MNVLICGGGTGGHIYPALAAVAELQKIGEEAHTLSFLWIGTRGEIEETLVPRAGLNLETISGGAIVGVPLKIRMVNAARLIGSMVKVNRLMAGFKPDVLLMTGGYVNVPVAIVARLRRVPSAIYLPDVAPGTAIKVLSRLVDKVACTTAASEAFLPADRLVVTGYPVRPEIRAARQMSRVAVLAQFDLTPGRPALFVFGGSRGARSINRALIAVLPQLLARTQVIHISGTLDWPAVAAFTETLPAGLRACYRPYPYLHETMGAAFRAADLAVARAGASMLGECPAFALPAVLIPYPHAWRYQKINADYLAGRGAAVRLDDAQLAEQLLSTVLELLHDRDRLSQMSAAMAALDVPDAARNLARLIIRLGQGASERGTKHD